MGSRRLTPGGKDNPRVLSLIVHGIFLRMIEP